MLLRTEAFTYFAGQLGNRNFTSVFGDRTSCRAKGLRPDALNWQFFLSFWRSNLISCERIARDNLEIAILPQFLAIEPHFVRKGCVSCRLVGTVPRLQERNRKEGESKRAREQEGKRECEDVKMRRCENVKMRRCEDEKM